MVNSKKSSKSLIALVVMAILLVASIVLGATGAWFTSYKDISPEDITFGNIEITTTGASREAVSVTGHDYTTDLMPGDELKINFSVTNTADEAWVAAKISVVVTPAAGETIDDAAFKAMFEGWYVNNARVEDAEGAAAALAFASDAYAETNETISFEIKELLDGDAYKDEWELATVTIKVEVFAVQAENVDATKAAQLITAEANATADEIADNEVFEDLTEVPAAGDEEEGNE